MKIVAVVQARMASTRLPGKVLKPLGDQTTLRWCVEAARNAFGVDKVVIATSTNKENDAIANEGEAAHVIRGSEDDVLDRYRLVIEETGADAIVRITGDCPLIDSRVIGEVIALYRSTGCDYASNIDPPTWPDGLDCEVISSEALLTAAKEATRPTDRDTVTQFITRNRARFSSKTLICPIPGLHKERWVLDSPEDYEFLQKIFANFGSDWHPNYLDILGFLNKNPELREINTNYVRNERFFDSLSEERAPKREFGASNLALRRSEVVIPLGAQTFSKSKLQYPTQAPLFVTHGNGGHVYDVDGNDYVDLVSGLLPNVLGYRDPDVDRAIRDQLDRGISFSLSTELEIELAEKLREIIPCAEMTRFGKNGTDVTTAAVRLARACTGRDQVLTSGYHGWADWASAHDKARNAGVTNGNRVETTLLNHGDMLNAERYLRSRRYACAIVEPETNPEFLMSLRRLCDDTGTILIFDEIITGFRVHLGGAQAVWGITPDLATFGKAMANGMPISALVGKREYMEKASDVCFSGTFFGEALSLAAALATIKKMQEEPVIATLQTYNAIAADLVDSMNMKLDTVPFIELTGTGLQRVKFIATSKYTAEDIKTLFMQEMIANGVLIIASNNFCYAHTKPDIGRVWKAYRAAFKVIEEGIKNGNLKEKIIGTAVKPTANVRFVSH